MVGAWSFPELVAAGEALREYVPAFRYRLYDLSAVEDAALWQEVDIGAWLALLKYIQRPELEGQLEAIFRALWRWVEMAGAETRVEALVTVLRYLAEAREGLSEERLRTAVERTWPKGGEAVATLAQKWLQEGLQEVGRRLEAIDDLDALQELLILAAAVERREAFEEALAA